MCTHVAHEIERIAGGWLTTRPLTDSGARALLARAGQNDEPSEPLLLEVTEEQAVRVRRGVGLRFALLRGLGLGRAARVWRIAHGEPEEAPPAAQEQRFGRRALLGRAAAGATAILFGSRLAGGAADAATLAGRAPQRKTTKLAANSRIIHELQGEPNIELAEGVFGSLDWRHAIKRSNRTGPADTRYVVPFDPLPEQTLGVLITNRPVARSPQELSEVVILTSYHQGEVRPRLYALNGQPLDDGVQGLPPDVSLPPVPSFVRLRRARVARAATAPQLPPLGLSNLTCIAIQYYRYFSRFCAPFFFSCFVLRVIQNCADYVICQENAYAWALSSCV